jgi:hypothetical protein
MARKLENGRVTEAIVDMPTCGKCGSAHTRVTGQSIAFGDGLLVQCQACGYATLVSVTKTAVPDVDTRRIERIVNGVITDHHLRCQLVAVTATNVGWKVTVRVDQGAVRQFDVKAAALSAMRGAITHALDVQRL